MAAAPRKSTTSPPTHAGKYLTFVLGAETYGVPVLRVREIIKVMPITAVPQVPAHMRGVVNLRGKVIPVTDLRMRLGLMPVDDTETTCIVVVDVEIGGESKPVGMLVDSVSEVITIAADQVEPTPSFGDGVRVDSLSGVAKVKGTVVLLLELDRALGASGFSF